MSNEVISFSVGQLLRNTSTYLIPMYQRNYAWGEAEINQLLQDIKDYQVKGSNQPYYLGTLVVFQRKDGNLEVIDGQQRLTTLTLLAIALKRLAAKNSLSYGMKWYDDINLDFECRKKSFNTLTELFNEKDIATLNEDEYNQDLITGFKILERLLENRREELKKDSNLHNFCDYLFNQVCIIQVPVPQKTDLNHYFEVMNTRGEQLEKHEVLKARLMNKLHDLSDENSREANIQVLANVWDAVANMERYVQYGFNTDERPKFFGNHWDEFKPRNFNDIKEILTVKEVDLRQQYTSFSDLLKIPLEKAQRDNKVINEGAPERFHSISNFPNFLLHVLRVATKKDIVLDDKQLISQFEEHLLNNATLEHIKEFIFALLKIKYLFDHYIIKREFQGEEDKGWSLQRLYYYTNSQSQSQSYKNTFGKEEDSKFESVNRRILMLQSALHVSTPTQSYKHWLNGALHILYCMDDITAESYLEQLEDMARCFVYGLYLTTVEPLRYYGVIYNKTRYQPVELEQLTNSEKLKYRDIANNFVFNYLDYLLWCTAHEHNSADKVIREFEFTFRSSVEHFYPQNPQDNHESLDEAILHRFGNLCLIDRSKNSRISNFQPESKYGEFFKTALSEGKIDSLKIHEMIKLMNNPSKKDTDKKWWEDEILQHEQKMLDLFVKDSKKGQINE